MKIYIMEISIKFIENKLCKGSSNFYVPSKTLNGEFGFKINCGNTNPQVIMLIFQFY